MIKIVRASKYWLLRHARMNFAVQKVLLEGQEIERKRDRKPYQVLFETSIEMTPKLPSPSLLKMLRARGITQIMAGNHALKHEGVLQAHIQCLFALISRLQLSIQGVTIFVEQVYKMIKQLESNNAAIAQQATRSSLFYLMKPQLLTKMVKIAQAIEFFYNQYLRILIGSFVVKAVRYSDSNYHKKIAKLQDLNNLKKQVISRKIIELDDNVVLTPENIDNYVEFVKNQINKAYPTLQFNDFLTGFEYLLGNGFYSEDFVKIGSEILAREGTQKTDNFNLVVNTIKALVILEKYKAYMIIPREDLNYFEALYNKSVERYFELLQNNRTFVEALHLQEATIQMGLVTEFLNKEHRQLAKVVYMKMFRKIFDNIENGSLFCDVKKIRGIFQIILIMFTHEDKAEVHEFLKQVERIMMIYPLPRFQRLQTHCSVAEKYHFKSDVFGDQYFRHLLAMNSKIQKNRGLIHSLHILVRRLHLADKFLTYMRVAHNPSKQDYTQAQELASSLFASSIMACFLDIDNLWFNLISSTSFANSLYFNRSSLPNLTAGFDERKKIESIMVKLQIKSINKTQNMLTRELMIGYNKFNLKSDHHFNWRHNPHARIASILRLAIHHYDFTKRKNQHEANTFINTFLSKTVGTSKIYSVIKKNFAYPEILDLCLEIHKRCEPGQYPILQRDLEAVKRLYSQHISKTSKVPQNYNIYYQQNLHDIEHNRVMVPYYQDLYNITGLAGLTGQGMIHQAVRRFYSEKEALVMEIETYCKFHKEGAINVTLNYFEYPHVADIKVKTENQEVVLLFSLQKPQKDDFYNQKHFQMQRNSEDYWKKRGFKIFKIQNPQDIQTFMNTKIKKIGTNSNSAI